MSASPVDLLVESIEGIADVEHIGDSATPPSLLVEVPHGADRREHYDALFSRLKGPLPERLEHFFFANTDVGAWQYGRRVAERVVERRGGSALVVRCLIPRTFIDTNRLITAEDTLSQGGLTPGIPPYIPPGPDHELLVSMHTQYTDLAARAYAVVCGGGGLALVPHSYGPRTMDIARVDEHIVEALHKAAEPAAWDSCPVRPEIDLLTLDGEGQRYAPEGMGPALVDAFGNLGIGAVESETYFLHVATQAHRWSTAHPEQVLCMEVRRDLLVERFSLFEEMSVSATAVEHVTGPLVDSVTSWLNTQVPVR